MAVRPVALTRAVAAPVRSSRTRVLAGRPRVSVDALGMETTLMADPSEGTCAGMTRAVWFDMGREVRGGEHGEAESAFAVRLSRNEGLKLAVIFAVSVAESIKTAIASIILCFNASVIQISTASIMYTVASRRAEQPSIVRQNE